MSGLFVQNDDVKIILFARELLRSTGRNPPCPKMITGTGETDGWPQKKLNKPREGGVILQEKTKEERIKSELSRLKKIYNKLPKNKLAIVIPLLENAAFMKITLDDLQNSINENGCSDEYKNGENQYGKKAAADLQAYNSLIKNYNTVSDRLEKLLPSEQKQSKLDELRNE